MRLPQAGSRRNDGKGIVARFVYISGYQEKIRQMPRGWKPPKEDRTDTEVVRRKRELAEKLAFAVEYGTEDEFVAAVKKFEPDVGKEDLKT